MYSCTQKKLEFLHHKCAVDFTNPSTASEPVPRKRLVSHRKGIDFPDMKYEINNVLLLLLSQWNDMLTAHSFAGYGNMSPSSSAGQIFCVFFALFGIPLNMVVLNRVGKYMLVIERRISNFLEGKTDQRVRRSNNLPSMFKIAPDFSLAGTIHSSLCSPPSHPCRGVPVSLSTSCLTCQEHFCSSLCRWLCSNNRRAGPTPRLSTTASSPSAPSALGTLWQVLLQMAFFFLNSYFCHWYYFACICFFIS